MLLAIMGQRDQPPFITGNVFKDGILDPVLDARIESVLGDQYYLVSLTVHIQTERRSYVMHGRVLSLVPLRHKLNSAPPGDYTRITEALVEFECEGRTALGMAEYCDLMIADKPVSLTESI